MGNAPSSNAPSSNAPSGNSPISAGDRAEVIWGVLGEKSPNLGLIVKVLSYIGDDPVFGRIWRCEAEYAEMWKDQEGANDAARSRKSPPGTADFAQSWLRKIEPPKDVESKDTEATKEKECQ